jgi:hypothetical protein
MMTTVELTVVEVEVAVTRSTSMESNSLNRGMSILQPVDAGVAVVQVLYPTLFAEKTLHLLLCLVQSVDANAALLVRLLMHSPSVRGSNKESPISPHTSVAPFLHEPIGNSEDSRASFPNEIRGVPPSTETGPTVAAPSLPVLLYYKNVNYDDHSHYNVYNYS